MKSLRIILPATAIILVLYACISCSKSETLDDQQYKGWIVGQEAGGFGTILSTSNDGLTWSRQGSQSQAAGVDLFDVHGLDQNNAWVVGGIYKGFGLILHTSNGGLTWSRQGNAIQVPAGKLFAVHATSLTSVWAAGEYSALIRTTDGGNTWSTATLPSAPVSTFYAITSFGKSIWVAGTSEDTATGETSAIVMYSGDAGSSWIRRDGGLPQSAAIYDVSAASDSILYVAGSEGILKSSNGGVSWIRVLGLNNRNVNGICAVDVQNVWAVSDGDGIFHTVSGGAKWDTIKPSITGFRIMGVTVADVNRIWIVGTLSSGSGTGNILYSRNAGNTWFIEDSPVKAGFRRVSFASARR